MKRDIDFSSSQCVLIENEEQLESIYHHFRSSTKFTYDEWVAWRGVPELPLYLEWAISVTRGASIGIIYEPRNTWTKEPYQVLTLEEATFKTYQ